MRALDLPQAKHFCSPIVSMVPGVEQPLPAFVESLGTHPRLVEGSAQFDIYRTNLLMSVERWLAFSVVNYRKAVEMLAPASAPWAQVTLYYASFFSANALLGMFGVWIGQARVVDVESGVASAQILRVHKGASAKSPNGERGSHLRFWDHFYATAAQLKPWVPPGLEHALDTSAVGSYGWQIGVRNDVNYDMFHAWDTSKLLHSTFKPAKLKSLSGPLRLQLDTSEALIRLSLSFANRLQVSALGLAGCGPNGSREQIQRQLIRRAPPEVLNQSAYKSFVN